jgi:bifunctional non-homologous end joining protein LigD
MRKEDFMLCQPITEQEALALDETKYQANIKFDGERIACQILNGSPVLLNRRGNICNLNFKEVVEELRQLGDVAIDGEMISLDDDFTKLQSRALTKNTNKLAVLEKTIPVKYMVFDIMYADNKNIMQEPLSKRLEELKKVFKDKSFKFVELAEYNNVKTMFEKAKAENREGIVIKLLSSAYESRRSSGWRKLKFWDEADIIFQKYTPNPAGIRVETNDGLVACQVAGSQSQEVAQLIDMKGQVELTIQYLSKNEETGGLRFPSFKKVVTK